MTSILAWDGKSGTRDAFLTFSSGSCSFFPLLVLGVKFASLFNPGDEMKKLTGRVNELEGTYESTLQFGLQLFIMLSRKDRMLSHLQWTTISTLTTSFLMVNKAGVQSYLQYENPNQGEENMSRTALQFTMFITANAFKLGSGALLVTIFSYWTILAYFFVVSHWRHMPFHPVALIRFGPRLWAPWGNLEFSEEEPLSWKPCLVCRNEPASHDCICAAGNIRPKHLTSSKGQ